MAGKTRADLEAELDAIDKELSRRGALQDKRVGALEAAGYGLVDGISMGWGDELAGIFSDELKHNLREGSRRSRRDQSAAYMGGQIGGGLATALLPGVGLAGGAAKAAAAAGEVGNAARLARLAGTVARNPITQGAAFGGVSAAGSQNGTVGERLSASLPGIVTGAGFGTAAYGAGKVLSALGEGAKFAASPAMRDPEIRAARVIGRNLERDGIQPADLTAARGRISANDPGGGVEETVGEIAQYARPVLPGATKRAATSEQLPTRPSANSNALSLALATVPGEAQNVARNSVAARVATRSERLSDASQRATGRDGSKFGETMDDIAEARRLQARDLYLAAYKAPIDATKYGDQLPQRLKDLREIFGDGLIRKASKKMLAEAGRRTSTPEMKALAREAHQQLEQHLQDPNQWMGVAALDAIKREIADRAKKALRSGRVDEGTVWSDLNSAFVQSIDEAANGQYRPALAAFGASKRLDEMAQGGRNILKTDSHDLAKLLRGEGPRGAISNEERDVFMLGVARAIEDALEGGAAGRKLINDWMGKPRVQRQFASAMGVGDGEIEAVLKGIRPRKASEAAEKYLAFRARLVREGNMKGFENQLFAGSQTEVRRQAVRANAEDGESIVGDLVEAIGDQAKRAPPGTTSGFIDRALSIALSPVGNAMKGVYNRVTNPGVYDPKVNAAIGDMWFKTATPEALARLEAAVSRGRGAVKQYLSPQQRAALAIALPGVAGNVAGQEAGASRRAR